MIKIGAQLIKFTTTKLGEKVWRGKKELQQNVHVEVCQSYYLVITRSILTDPSLLWTPAPLKHCATLSKFLYQRVFSKDVTHFHVIFNIKPRIVERLETSCFQISSMMTVPWEVDSKHLLILFFYCNILSLEMKLIHSYLVGPHIQVSWQIAHHKSTKSLRYFPALKSSCSSEQILPLLICTNSKECWEEHCIGEKQIYFRLAAVPLTKWAFIVSHSPWESD